MLKDELRAERIQKWIAFVYNRNSANNIEVNPTQVMAVKLLYELYAEKENEIYVDTIESCK
ncbi:MAG: hypothetical protein N3B21_08470 [Clostridia bacterium]|nr:hypothetical protein [Clostridia bacterium]